MVGIEKIPECKYRWNTNEEILQYLSYACLNPHLLKKKHIIRPKNGAMLLFDRTKVRYKSDGYDWKKRKDGKNVREDHMKLKVNGVECLYGAYVHNESVTNFHRRCYWKLKTPKVVLVHYLYVADQIHPGTPSISQFERAISQLQHIFNVPESKVKETLKTAGGGGGESNGDDLQSTKASQLLLILRKEGEQIKPDQEDKSGLEDKVTQTDRLHPGPCHSDCCARSRDLVTCISPQPSSSKDHMEIDELETLVSRDNPLLSTSSGVVDDMTSLLDPIVSTSLNHTVADVNCSNLDLKNDFDSFFNNPDLLKDDLAFIKDKDSKLFELFEEVNSTYSNPQNNLQVETVEPHENIPVGQKRKFDKTCDTPIMIDTPPRSSMDTTTPPYFTPDTLYQPLPLDPLELAPEPVLPPVSEPVLPTATRHVAVTTISPDWSYLAGGEKVVLVGDWEQIAGRVCVMFENTMVPAQQLRNGVIQVICPSSPRPGPVIVNIVSDGTIITDSKTKFTYKDQQSPSQWLQVVDSNFKYSLINRLEDLESQVRMLSSGHYTGDLQTRMCSVTLPILQHMTSSMRLPPSPKGLRLIHLAAAIGYSRLVLLLLRFPFLSECNPFSLDDMGNNALVWACAGGHAATIYLLLKCCPKLRLSRDGWGRCVKEVYKTGNVKGESAARTIQLHYRTYKQKKLNQAATRIQSRFRSYKQKCTFEEMRRAVVIIQQTYRDHMKTKEVAAKTIQRCWRQTSRQRRVLGIAGNSSHFY